MPTDEDRELIEALQNMARSMKYGPDESWIEQAADRLESLLSDRAKLELLELQVKEMRKLLTRYP